MLNILEVDNILKNIDGTLAVEGKKVSASTRKITKQFLKGVLTSAEAIAKIKAIYNK